MNQKYRQPESSANQESQGWDQPASFAVPKSSESTTSVEVRKRENIRSDPVYTAGNRQRRLLEESTPKTATSTHPASPRASILGIVYEV